MRETSLVRSAAIAVLLAAALGACADRPEIDQIAQVAIIGLSRTDIRACLGEPAGRRHVGQATEIWSYPDGVTTTETPPWAIGLDFSVLEPRENCDVKLIMTNGRVSQVNYSLPDGRALPLGRQCSFAVQECARRRELL